MIINRTYVQQDEIIVDDLILITPHEIIDYIVICTKTGLSLRRDSKAIELKLILD